jgi:hypothetical protein
MAQMKITTKVLFVLAILFVAATYYFRNVWEEHQPASKTTSHEEKAK